MKVVSLVIPCYNEAETIAALAERLSSSLSEANEHLSVSFELIFVDDGSSDNTFESIRKLDFQWPCRLIVLSRNFGKEPALTAGIDAAMGDAVILMDADLQHPPERISDLIKHWQDGAEVVYFYKRDRKNEGVGKNAGAALFFQMINFGARIKIPPNAGDFRLLDRRALDALRRMPERERFLKGMYAWIGFNQLGLPLDIPERHENGKTRFTFTKLFGLAVDGLTSFSTAPIRLISVFGFVVSIVSVIYLMWIIGEWFIFGGPFSGFATIVVLVVFFGGAQLVCLGIIGEYIGKALLEGKQRPHYLVRHSYDIPVQDD